MTSESEFATKVGLGVNYSYGRILRICHVWPILVPSILI